MISKVSIYLLAQYIHYTLFSILTKTPWYCPRREICLTIVISLEKIVLKSTKSPLVLKIMVRSQPLVNKIFAYRYPSHIVPVCSPWANQVAPWINIPEYTFCCCYKAVQYNMILVTSLQWSMGDWNHKSHPIFRHYGRAMGWILWGFCRKLTAL